MAPIKGKAPAAAGFDFGNLDAYSSGGGMLEGDYAIASIMLCMFAGTKKDGSSAGPERLGAKITFRPLTGGDDQENFYSLGSKAHESWQPREDGKGLVAVTGGPGTAPNASTNWAMFVKSLFDSGLPQGVLQDDLSVLEGTHVHIQNVPEPAERKGFKALTGEAGMEDKPRTVAIVSEIKDDGKPWEGTGGVPEVEAAAPKTAAKPVVGKAPVKAPVKAAAKAAPAPEPEADGDLESHAINGISAVLTGHEQGMPTLQLRTGTFKAVKDAVDQPTANTVVNTFFKNNDTLNGILGTLGYVVKGAQIVPVE